MEDKYFCGNCKGLRNHKILFELKKSGEEGFGAFQWIEKFIVIECAGCENISFQKTYGDSSMIDYGAKGEPEYYEEKELFPYHLKFGFELDNLYLIPDKISHIYKETINAQKADAFLLTAAGFRAVIEAVCNHLKIKKTNLEERINLLHTKGHLSLAESKRLHTIRFLGNDALHEIETPKKDHLYILLEIVNHLLASLFINDKIIEGKLDTVLDDYESFTRLVQNLIKKDMIGSEIGLDKFLGKSKRLISKQNLIVFEEKMFNEIKSGDITYLEIINLEDRKMKIISEPELTFLPF